MNIVKSSGKIFIAGIGGGLVIFLGLTYFSRNLPPKVVGSFFLFYALLKMLSILSDFGIRGGIEKRLSEGGDTENILSSALLFKSALFVLTVCMVLILRPHINRYIGLQASKLLVVTLFTRESFSTVLFTLNGELRAGETAILRFTQKVVWIGFAVVFISTGFGVYGIIYGLMVGHIVCSIWGMSKISIYPSYPSFDNISFLLEYSKFYFISYIGGYSYSWIDILLIGLFLTRVEVSSYEFAWRITEIVILFSNSIALVVLPQVSHWSSNNAIEKIETLLGQAVTASLFFVIPAFFGSTLLAKEILGLVFGQEYTIAWAALIILMGEAVFQSFHKVVSRVLLGINKPAFAAKATVVTVILNIVLNVLFIIHLGLIGAALATGISFALNALLHGWFLSKFITIQFNFKDIGKCTFCAACMTIVLSYIEANITIESVPTLVAIVMIGTILYLLFTMSFTSLRNKTTNQLKTLM